MFAVTTEEEEEEGVVEEPPEEDMDRRDLALGVRVFGDSLGCMGGTGGDGVGTEGRLDPDLSCMDVSCLLSQTIILSLLSAFLVDASSFFMASSSFLSRSTAYKDT